MKAISIREPWASMITNGLKTIETRTWNTNHRGKLLLCASRIPRSDISGKAFAVADLVDVRPMTKDHEKKACCEIYHRAKSWILDNVTPIDTFPVKGQFGLFDVDYNS
jgi:hypothetical protein